MSTKRVKAIRTPVYRGSKVNPAALRRGGKCGW
jgi:hypothetical protein